MNFTHTDNTQMAKINIKLQALMEARGITRMDIVRGANLSYPTVSRWASNDVKKLDPETLNKLRAFFNVSDDELYEIVED